jgi:hypothetical protein
MQMYPRKPTPYQGSLPEDHIDRHCKGKIDGHVPLLPEVRHTAANFSSADC